ncbi:MAG: hypothetical protein ACMXYA_03070 [Candidatus Woesearchaeota archaeon]
MYTKRGVNPTGTGAPFIIVLTFLIVFYILFLPPADRAALLDNDVIPGTGGTGTPTHTTRSSSAEFEEIFPGPGPVSAQTRTEYEHILGSFTLRGEFNARVIESYDDFSLYTTVFSQNVQTRTFHIDDLRFTENVLLTFNVPQAEGHLEVYLNGFEILSAQITSYNVGPILLRNQHLSHTNELEFRVSSPGLQFWQRNEYVIESLRIVGDIIDPERLRSTQSFDLRPVEVQQFQSAQLRFIPECQQLDASRLFISVNNNTIYSSLPDCGTVNIIPIPRNSVREGENTLTFETSDGAYTIDVVRVRTQLDQDEGVTHFFELDTDFFTSSSANASIKSEYEGFIDIQFVDDGRRKQAELLVNGVRVGVDTRQDVFTRRIGEFLQPRNNYIQVIPLNDFSLVQTTVRIEKR